MKKMTALILILALMMTAVSGMLAEENKIWKKGDTGETVTWIQTRLKELEYLEKDPTGTFDEDTENALSLFQRYEGLLITGMADAVTMKRLETATKRISDYARYDVYEDYEAAEGAVYYDAGAMNVMATSMPMMTVELFVPRLFFTTAPTVHSAPVPAVLGMLIIGSVPRFANANLCR